LAPGGLRFKGSAASPNPKRLPRGAAKCRRAVARHGGISYLPSRISPRDRSGDAYVWMKRHPPIAIPDNKAAYFQNFDMA
jgi:hypothetical protein